MRVLHVSGFALTALALVESVALLGYFKRQTDHANLARTVIANRFTPQFRVQLVKTLGGDKVYHGGGAINDYGQVVGATLTAQGEWHAFLWDCSSLVDLGTLGGSTSSAWAINNGGQVVGRSDTSFGEHAFLWEKGKILDLGTLPSYTHSAAMGINDQGKIVGRVYRPTQGPYWTWPSRAFCWKGGRMAELGLPRGCVNAQASAINSGGQIVGRAVDRAGRTRAIIWDRGTTVDLGQLTNRAISAATCINNKGQIVGSAGDAAGSMRAVMWERNVHMDTWAVRWLPTLPYHTDNLATVITNDGTIYGSAKVGSEYAPAVVWEANSSKPRGVIMDMLRPDSEWFISQVFAVNNQGQLLVYGFHGNEKERLAVLSPATQSEQVSQ